MFHLKKLLLVLQFSKRLGVSMQVWQRRTLKLALVAGAFYIARYFALCFFSSFHMDFDINQTLKWMEAHPNLSGWAQFVGAIAAILLAIAIPAWQRHGQSLDRWRDAEDLNASLSQNSFYLLSEIRNYLRGYQGARAIPRGIMRNDELRNDLLRRIHELELREINPDRITRLFFARGAIHGTNTSIAAGFQQDNPLSDGEEALLAERIGTINSQLDEAEIANRKAIQSRAHAHLWLLPRIAFPVVMFIAR